MAENSVNINSLASVLSGASLEETKPATMAAPAPAKPARRVPSSTPEYDSFLSFAERCDWTFTEAKCGEMFGPGARVIERRDQASLTMEQVAQDHLVGSKPLIVTGSLETWNAKKTWDPDWFARTYPDDVVIANDRAPARKVDRMTLRPQSSVRIKLPQYVKYMKSFGRDEKAPPLYLNGWHAFKEHAELCGDIESPAWIEDHTVLILQQIDKAIAGGGGKGAGGEDGAWVHNTDVLLNKVFMGPAGNITRLHFDAHRAHGWLAQVRGRKLFVLFPPADSGKLYPLEGEATTQSPCDPLDPSVCERYPKYGGASLQYAILEEGETILCPEGWWHFACSLSPSVTVMRNFYHALSNVHGLVGLFANLNKKKNKQVK